MNARVGIGVQRNRFFGLLVLLVGAFIFGACGSEDTGDDTYYYLAGHVEGLQDTGLILQNNGAHDHVIEEDGEFWFSETFPDGHEYNVTVFEAPPNHNCSVYNGSGVIDGENVVDIDVECTVSTGEDPAHFSVAIDSGQSTLNIQGGGTAVIVANIENTGDHADTQNITLEVDGEVVDTHSNLDLSPGDSDSVTLQWSDVPEEFGTYPAVVSSEDDSATASVTVGPEPGTAYFEVSISSSVSTLDVVEGEVVSVRATVSNIGDVQATQEVTLSIAGEVVDSRMVDLTAGFADSFDLQWHTTTGDAGSYAARVASEDDSETVDVFVEVPPDPPFFEVAIDETASVMETDVEGSIIFVVEVENTGEVAGTQDIELVIGEDHQFMEPDLALDGQASQTVTFEWETTIDDAGKYDAVVWSEDTSDVAEVLVYPPPGVPYFHVDIDADDSDLFVEQGEMVTVVADIENLGDTADIQDIVLEIDGAEEDVATDVEIEGFETMTVFLEWQTADGDAGYFEATALSDDSSASETVIVYDPDVANLMGFVADTRGLENMEGVEVVLIDTSTDEETAAVAVDDEGFYWIESSEFGDHELILRAPGLEPNYEIDEFGGDNEVLVDMQPGLILQDLTIDWQRTTDLVFDGSLFDLQYEPGQQGEISFTVPGCQQQADGSWVSDGGDPNSTFDPEEACFQISDVAIDLHTGELDIDVDDVVFADVLIEIGGEDFGDFDDLLSVEEIDLQWHFDGATGEVDFTDGSLELGLEVRILVGGTASVMGGFFGDDVEFGLRAGNMDCQLADAWGGDVDNPQLDADDEQVGAYFHDPIQMQLVTGESGPHGVEGAPFDADTRSWAIADNAMEIGALSEGGDPGGSACGEVNTGFSMEDTSALLNGTLELPSTGGAHLGEFNVLMR